MNNCMFQYATKYTVLVNTTLISREDAVKLFDKNTDDFKKRLINDESPEMCIWISCEDDNSCGETLKYWDDSIKVIDDRLYQLVG